MILIKRYRKTGAKSTFFPPPLKNLGVLDTEQFISTLLKEPFDYTEWSREYFADYEPDQFLKDAVEYDKSNPVQTSKEQ